MDNVIRTSRLYLAPVTCDDASDIRRLAGDAEVARDATSIPHPFEAGMAETWIENLREVDEVFSIRTAELTPLIGLAGLIRELENDSAELSYWIGRAYWGYGYASEAVKSIVAFGFEQMGLHRIFATCLARNAASARILEVNGFTREGLLRQHVKHWHNFENLLYFGILKEEYFRKP